MKQKISGVIQGNGNTLPIYPGIQPSLVQQDDFGGKKPINPIGSRGPKDQFGVGPALPPKIDDFGGQKQPRSPFDVHMENLNATLTSNAEAFSKAMLDMEERMGKMSEQYTSQLSNMQNAMTAANAPPNKSVLGIKGAQENSSSVNSMLRRQGVAGSFARNGLRINSLNLN